MMHKGDCCKKRSKLALNSSKRLNLKFLRLQETFKLFHKSLMSSNVNRIRHLRIKACLSNSLPPVFHKACCLAHKIRPLRIKACLSNNNFPSVVHSLRVRLLHSNSNLPAVLNSLGIRPLTVVNSSNSNKIRTCLPVVVHSLQIHSLRIGPLRINCLQAVVNSSNSNL